MTKNLKMMLSPVHFECHDVVVLMIGLPFQIRIEVNYIRDEMLPLATTKKTHSLT